MKSIYINVYDMDELFDILYHYLFAWYMLELYINTLHTWNTSNWRHTLICFLALCRKQMRNSQSSVEDETFSTVQI